jgi:starvation-inducible DNA-binding protein
VRKLGASTLHSIGDIGKRQSIKDNDKDFVEPADMLKELMEDNKSVIKAMRKAHEIADKHEDVATASILENFIDQAEKRNWFLFEASRS